jgi:hypothetical protein
MSSHERGSADGGKRHDRRADSAMAARVELAIIYRTVFGMHATERSGLLAGIEPATVERIRRKLYRYRCL